MNIKNKLSILIISLLLSNCSIPRIFQVVISQGNLVDQEMLDKLEIGMTESQVKFVMGSPLISDPGFKFIKYCIKNNIKITTVPGPNSIIPALQLSGLPINEFYFAGFFPKTSNKIKDFINEIKEKPKTVVFFVSNHKINICLEFLEKELGDRLISISKELTKLNERVFRGLSKKIKEDISKNNENLKGEFVVVVEGKVTKKTPFFSLEDHNEQINLLLSKFTLTDVVEIVHKLTGLNKNKIYKWVLNLKKS